MIDNKKLCKDKFEVGIIKCTKQKALPEFCQTL